MNDDDTEASIGALADAAPMLDHQMTTMTTIEQPPVEAEAPKEPPKSKRKGSKRGIKQEVSEAQERAANIPPEQLGLGLFLPDVAQAAEDANVVFAKVPLADIEPDPENARLESDPESAARHAASCEAILARDGFGILASRHESTTGFALWNRPDEDGFVIYGRGWDELSPAR